MNIPGKVASTLLIFLISGPVIGGNLAIPNTFSNGEIADADEINKNFTDTQSAVNDNSARIDNLTKRTLSFPARVLAFTQSTPQTTVSIGDYGLDWEFDGKWSARLMIKRPGDYHGGDITFRVVFMPRQSGVGEAGFFIRPRSLKSGESLNDVLGIESTPVVVAGGANRVYEQVFTIPEGRMGNAWWYITVQRDERTAYTGTIAVLGVALEYEAMP